MSFERWENQMADDFDHGQHEPCELCEDEECTCDEDDGYTDHLINDYETARDLGEGYYD